MNLRYFILSLCIISSTVKIFAQPAEFIENRGQWGGSYKYRANTGRGEVFLDKDGFMFLLGDPENRNNMDAVHHGLKPSATLKFHAYEVSFKGAHTQSIEGSKIQKTYYNYFLGNDPLHWKSNIHPYLCLDYKQLYSGIDMHITSERKNIEYSFIVKPHADASLIQIAYKGQDKLRIKEGNLEIVTSVGNVLEMKPYAYQYIKDERVQVPCDYVIKGNTVSFDMPNGYDSSETLVIDPTIVFCTFTGSTADNWGFTATYDAQGNFYAGGLVNALPSFPNNAGAHYPVTAGAFQISFGGGSSTTGSNYPCDMAIMKFDATGVNRIYATYIGGSDNEQPHSLIVDANNNLILAGRTYSNNFPVTANAYNTSLNGGSDIVICRLNASGTALLGSTYLGGSGDDVVNFNSLETVFGNLKHNYGDDARSEVQVDKNGNVYVVASTKSTNFPVTGNALQSTLKGTQDGVICKLDSNLSNLIYSTYVGGNGDDAAYVIVFDTNQTHFYVGGGTQSTNFPSTAGTLYSSYQGGPADGFILKFLNSGNYAMQAGTFMGTSNEDQVYGLQVDRENMVYAEGQSLGGAFPINNVAYSNANSSQYLIKLDSNLSTNIFSTEYGSGDPSHTNISPVAFLVDTCENIYISGWGGTLVAGAVASVGTTNNLPITPNAAQSTTDGSDFYFIVFSKNVSSLLYATYFGRYSTDVGKGEHVDGGTSRFDKNGVIYQAICGNCYGSGGTTTAFPTQPAGVWSTVDSNLNCNEAALKIAFAFGPVNAHAIAAPGTHGCAPFKVTFADSSTNGATYYWDFGDGTHDTSFTPTPHIFTHAGTYTVKLGVYNANACSKLSDTFIFTIVVDSINVKPSFTFTKIDSCGPYNVMFTNTSLYSSTPGSQGFTTFTCYFGDGTTYSGVTPPTHGYPGADTFNVMLVMKDTTACNSPDTAYQRIIFGNSSTSASFTAPDSVCKGSSVTFINTSTHYQNSYWVMNNGQTSTLTNFTYTFDSLGTYTITLVSILPGACKSTDTFKRVVTVLDPPVANFTFSPNPPVTNEAINFTNTSVNASSYLWDFNDGNKSTQVSPSHFFETSGNFNVCLSAFNNSNCPSTLCKLVKTDIQPNANVPNAFSPNGDGSNDIFFVRGVAIKNMDLKIFNRWGEVVFHTTDQNVGWDGTFNGKPQEMESYAFVLHVEFYGGTTMDKKGNITLLR
jgi:gliding motility-associated-like protein